MNKILPWGLLILVLYILYVGHQDKVLIRSKGNTEYDIQIYSIPGKQKSRFGILKIYFIIYEPFVSFVCTESHNFSFFLDSKRKCRFFGPNKHFCMRTNDLFMVFQLLTRYETYARAFSLLNKWNGLFWHGSFIRDQAVIVGTKIAHVQGKLVIASSSNSFVHIGGTTLDWNI